MVCVSDSAGKRTIFAASSSATLSISYIRRSQNGMTRSIPRLHHLERSRVDQVLPYLLSKLYQGQCTRASSHVRSAWDCMDSHISKKSARLDKVFHGYIFLSFASSKIVSPSL